MNCKRCGQCCHAYGITLSIEDMNREPRLWDGVVPIQKVDNPKTQAFMKEHNHFWVIKKPHRGAACPFYCNQSCLIYDTRPWVCRNYPKGGRCIKENQCLRSDQ